MEYHPGIHNCDFTMGFEPDILSIVFYNPGGSDVIENIWVDKLIVIFLLWFTIWGFWTWYSMHFIS